MRATLITFGTLTLFAVSPAFALNEMGTIKDSGEGPTTVTTDTGAGTELLVGVGPASTLDATRTIDDSDAMRTIDDGQDGPTSIGTDTSS